jgi:hypothetical protein
LIPRVNDEIFVIDDLNEIVELEEILMTDTIIIKKKYISLPLISVGSEAFPKSCDHSMNKLFNLI